MIGDWHLNDLAGAPNSHLPHLSFVSGKQGIICLEDLIHEIYSVGEGFKAANDFLLPFRLSVPRHAARDKVGILKDVGNPGFRGSDINAIIRLLNWGQTTSWRASSIVRKSSKTRTLCVFLWLGVPETGRPETSQHSLRLLLVHRQHCLYNKTIYVVFVTLFSPAVRSVLGCSPSLHTSWKYNWLLWQFSK